MLSIRQAQRNFIFIYFEVFLREKNQKKIWHLTVQNFFAHEKNVKEQGLNGRKMNNQ